MAAFPLAFALSSLAGLLWLAWISPNVTALEVTEEMTTIRVRFDAGLSALAGGLLGARIVFALAHWGYYAKHPLETLQFWKGGLSWPGSVAGALLALLLYVIITRRPFWILADTLVAPAALLSFGLWIGCLMDNCAYGVGGQSGSLAIMSADIFGVVSRRWPTQAVGAACSALILLAAFLLRGRLTRPGLLASIILALLAGTMLLLSLTRGDPVGMLWGARLDTWGSAVMLAAALAGVGLRMWRK